MHLPTVLSLLMVALTIAAGKAHSAPLTLHFYERPPYMIRQADGSASGLTADRARAVFQRAGIAVQWKNTPAKRQLSLIRFNSAADCGIGWFRNAERESFAQFSLPIYRDLPPVVIANQKFQPAAPTSLATVLADPRVRVLLKDGLTYGSYVAEQVRTAAAVVQRVTNEQPQLVRMIAAGRADFMFATGEEARFLVTMEEAGDDAVRVLTFADIPPGEPRYLMCSRQVSAETLTKLDAAITQLKLP